MPRNLEASWAIFILQVDQFIPEFLARNMPLTPELKNFHGQGRDETGFHGERRHEARSDDRRQETEESPQVQEGEDAMGKDEMKHGDNVKQSDSMQKDEMQH
jgi:hypothetical protein